jgi:hypothetical protein
MDEISVHPETLAGDGFAYAGEAREPRSGVDQVNSRETASREAVLHGDCPACFAGFVTITVEEDGEEHDEAVPCRRCGGLEAS